jgi:hypothetical protein
VDTICSTEVVPVPATQEVTRCVTTKTSVGPIKCESCNCADQHNPVSPDGRQVQVGAARNARG